MFIIIIMNLIFVKNFSILNIPVKAAQSCNRASWMCRRRYFMATKENFFRTSDGLYLYFEDTGGVLRPLILIPGFSASTKIFHRSVPVLAEHYRVITMDPRGHGRSMKVAGNNRLDRMALDIKELIDHLKLENVILIGHSLGGSQVAHYAEKCQEYKLSGIILADATR